MIAAQPGSSAGPEGAAAKARVLAGAAFAVAGEAAIVAFANDPDVSAPAMLAMHALVVGVLAAVFLANRRAGGDRTLAAIVILAVAVAGPAGAVAAFAALAFRRSGSTPSRTLKNWYDRLAHAGRPSPETVLYDRIASGRVPLLETGAPDSFLNVIETGTLAERQKALGLIARRFHPDYTTVLEAALNSPEPVVRVQAAAVVARVRMTLKEDVKRLTGDMGAIPAAETFERVARLRALETCALADPGERALCKAAANRLLESLFGSRGAGTIPAARASHEAADAAETFLLASGRFKDLRVMRRLRAVMERPGYRLRRLGEGRLV